MEQELLLTATEQGKRIGSLALCPIKLVESYIDSIENNFNSEKIFTKITSKMALMEAKFASARAKNGSRLSELDGVPISWKDLFDTKNIETSGGTKLLQGRIPNSDAQVVKNAKKLGLVFLGKTHMTEFAFSGLGVNPITQTPPNSICSQLAPGGSSSGAAVSVGLRLVSGAIGSDTGGSVRVPASWNNLVGLKTTYGLLSLKGVLPLCKNFDSIGPIVRSVEDAANLLSILEGKSLTNISKINLEGKKMAVLETIAQDDLDQEIKDNFERTIEGLKSSGVHISRLKSDIINDAMSLSGKLFSPEAYGIWRSVIESNPEKMYPPILERFRSGSETDAPSYIESWQTLSDLRSKYKKLTFSFDCVLLPTTPMLPPNTAKLLENKHFFKTQNIKSLRNTRIANLLLLPALTIPTERNFCGLMLMGKSFQEANLLKIGKAMEKIINKS